MKPGIKISKIWFDEDVIELRIEVSDGTSFFSNQVYAWPLELEGDVSALNNFRYHFHGGLLNLRFGEFGCEYANGAFQARFHFPRPGRLYVSCDQESEFKEFAEKTVASTARLYLESEPGLLDRFVSELQLLISNESDTAYLEGVI